jgi:hypothetical protein
MNADNTTPRDLRIAIACYWDGPLYQLASAANIHPVTLSAILHGRMPLKPQLTARILEVLQTHTQGETVHAR